MKTKILLVIITTFFLSSIIRGQIIHVPADQPTIQQGINAASTGDTVLVDTGTYNENIIELEIDNIPLLAEPFTIPIEYHDNTRNFEKENAIRFERILTNSDQPIDSILAEQFQQVIDEAIVDYNIKGLSAAVSTKSGDIWTGASGISHDTVNMNTDMLLGIGSITKNFIATIILQLYEEGALDLSDSLYYWLENFQHIDTTITIKQLLNHTSGIFDYLWCPGIEDSVLAYGAKIWTSEEIIDKFVLPPYFQPGMGWHYSNTNYLLLGMIIEEVTGNEVVEELHERLTSPIGLSSLFLYPDEDYEGFRAHCWMPINGTLVDLTEIEDSTWYSIYWTAGAILTTPKQLVKWQKGLYEENLLNDTTLEIMKQPAPYSGGSYGLGTQIGSLNGEWVYGHTGDVVYYSQLLYVPSDSLSIAVISNTRFAPINNIWLDLYTTYMNVTGVDAKIVEELKLEVYPNPFSTKTTIAYELQHSLTVQLTIYNHLGELIKVTQQKQSSGKQQVVLNATGWPAGVYCFRLQADEQVTTGKLVVVR